MGIATAFLLIAGVRLRIRAPNAHGTAGEDATPRIFIANHMTPAPSPTPRLPQILNTIGGAYCLKAKTAMANAQTSQPAAATSGREGYRLTPTATAGAPKTTGGARPETGQGGRW